MFNSFCCFCLTLVLTLCLLLCLLAWLHRLLRVKIKIKISLFTSWGALAAETYLDHVQLVVVVGGPGLVTGEILWRCAALRPIILGVVHVTATGGSLLGYIFCFTNELNFWFSTVSVGGLEAGWALGDLHQLLIVDSDLLGLAAAQVVLQDVIPVKALATLVALIWSVKRNWEVSQYFLDFDSPDDSEQKYDNFCNYQTVA